MIFVFFTKTLKGFVYIFWMEMWNPYERRKNSKTNIWRNLNFCSKWGNILFFCNASFRNFYSSVLSFLFGLLHAQSLTSVFEVTKVHTQHFCSQCTYLLRLSGNLHPFTLLHTHDKWIMLQTSSALPYFINFVTAHCEVH